MDDQPDLCEVILQYQNYVVRPWKPEDRDTALAIVETCVGDYGVSFEKYHADFKDATEVEEHYWKDRKGEFWVCEELETGMVVGTAAYCEKERGSNAVEIRKLYLLPRARGKGLGRAILETLEKRIKERGYGEIYIKTVTVLREACKLYQSAGYREAGIPEKLNTRCDLMLKKSVAHYD